MTGGGKEIGGLFVDSFELVGYLENLDCSVDAGDYGRERIYVRSDHLGSFAEKGGLVVLAVYELPAQ